MQLTCLAAILTVLMACYATPVPERAVEKADLNEGYPDLDKRTRRKIKVKYVTESDDKNGKEILEKARLAAGVDGVDGVDDGLRKELGVVAHQVRALDNAIEAARPTYTGASTSPHY